jgi:hypothetical protein
MPKLLDIVDAVARKLAELGPYRKSELVDWIKAEYGKTNRQALKLIYQAEARSGKVASRDSQQIIAEMVSVLDAVMYDPEASHKSRIEAVRAKANLLNLWRQPQPTVPLCEPMTAEEYEAQSSSPG